MSNLVFVVRENLVVIDAVIFPAETLRESGEEYLRRL